MIQPSLRSLRADQECGFSSNIVGNLIGDDNQWHKLELCQKIADDVWVG